MDLTDQYLVYKLRHSGTSNERMSLEIAIGLASLSERKLILYGKEGSSFGIRPSRGGRYKMERHGWLENGKNLPDYRPSLVTDLYEKLPREISIGSDGGSLPESWFFGTGNQINVFNHPIRDYCLCRQSTQPPNSLPSIAEGRGKSFVDGRLLLHLPSEPIWRMEGSNLSYYSRFFYDLSGTVAAAVQGMKLCAWMHSFAESVVSRIGLFNGCHIRLTDLLQFLPQSSDYNKVIADVIAESLPRDQLLVITTDEDPSSCFFDPLKQRFPKLLFLDEYLRSDCSELWTSVPYLNESVLAVICQLILEKSSIFMGTIGSTFTGLIHRGWLHRKLADGASLSDSHFRFTHCGIAGAAGSIPGYFEEGQFVESQKGLFSWNRISIKSATKDQLGWYREWPECALGLNYAYFRQ